MNLALCKWLTDSHHDHSSYLSYVREMDNFYHAEAKLTKQEVSLFLANYLDAGACERVLEIFAQHPRLRPPTNLETIPLAGQMVYVLCQHSLGLRYDADQVRAATTAFLDREVDSWLQHGQSLRAARWMKIAYWNPVPEPERPRARETVLKCYDHLPGVKKPDGRESRKPWWRLW